MSTKQSTLLYKGEKFASQGSGRFAKDVVRLGKWIHPATGETVEFTKERIQKLVENTTMYLARGNKIPFPDGHTFDVTKNLGYWPGPFIEYKGALVGVVEPKAEAAILGMMNGSLDAVSVRIDYDVMDPKGNKYDEVITHVCATNYPVITEQEPFVQLSRIGESTMVMEDLSKLVKGEADPGAQKAFEQMCRSFGQSDFDRMCEALKL